MGGLSERGASVRMVPDEYQHMNINTCVQYISDRKRRKTIQVVCRIMGLGTQHLSVA